jgi:lipopolysaccharide transport system ATP-binding protein
VNFRVPCYFNNGIYTITVGLHSEEGLSYDWIDDIVIFEVKNSNICDGIVDLTQLLSR